LIGFIIDIVARGLEKFGDAISNYRNHYLSFSHPAARFYRTSSISNPRKNKNLIRIGCNTHFRGEIFLFNHDGEISIGEFCYIGEGTKIWSARKISIGNRVLIAHNVNIFDNNSHPINYKERRQHFLNIINSGHPNTIDLQEKEIIIEDDVWIGFNSTILKGVRVGEGSIIAASSLVTNDVPPFTLVAGHPAKVIKTLSRE
jgi:acetyltransferase-like isoleucine patch superfamily enzyme